MESLLTRMRMRMRMRMPLALLPASSPPLQYIVIRSFTSQSHSHCHSLAIPSRPVFSASAFSSHPFHPPPAPSITVPSRSAHVMKSGNQRRTEVKPKPTPSKVEAQPETKTQSPLEQSLPHYSQLQQQRQEQERVEQLQQQQQQQEDQEQERFEQEQQLHAPPSLPLIDPRPSLHSSPQFVEGQLTRDFISTSLYSYATGYFNSSPRVYSSRSPSALSFSSLRGRTGYYQALDKLYQEYDDCWLTPVELFKPWFGEAVAKWLVQAYHRDGQKISRSSTSDSESDSSSPPRVFTPLFPFRILEVGGGNGTCALNVLDYIERVHPELYPLVEYTIVDLSTLMHSRQTEALQRHIHAGIARVRIENMSGLDWLRLSSERRTSHAHANDNSNSTSLSTDSPSSSSSSPDFSPLYVIGLEVLDNMPHDKVVSINDRVHQCNVYSGDGGMKLSDPHVEYHEQYQDVKDELIMEYLRLKYEFDQRKIKRKPRYKQANLSAHLALALSSFSSRLHSSVSPYTLSYSSHYLPTTCLLFLSLLHSHFPNHHLLLADFDSLPGAIPGKNGPVVSGKGTGTEIGRKGKESGEKKGTTDYKTYLIGLGKADIFFPTNFEMLKFMYQQVGARAREGMREEIEKADEKQRTLMSDTDDHDVRVYSNYEFMKEYSDWKHTTTNRGPFGLAARFNPMLEDYVNFKFFVT